jgi:hypothetical protein
MIPCPDPDCWLPRGHTGPHMTEDEWHDAEVRKVMARHHAYADMLAGQLRSTTVAPVAER